VSEVKGIWLLKNRRSHEAHRAEMIRLGTALVGAALIEAEGNASLRQDLL